MLILAPIYIRPTPHFHYLSELSQYFEAAGMEQLPCCYNTRKIIFFKVFPHLKDLQAETIWGQTDRMEEPRDKQISHFQVVCCQNCQLFCVSPHHKSHLIQWLPGQSQRYAKSRHHISTRNNHFLPDKAEDLMLLLPMKSELWKCQPCRLFFLIRKSRDFAS